MQIWILHKFKIFVFFVKDIVSNELPLRRLHVFYRCLTNKIPAKKGELGHLSSLGRKKTKLGNLHSHVPVFPTHWQKFSINQFKINKFCKMLFSFLRFSEVKIQMISRVLMPSSVERIGSSCS